MKIFSRAAWVVGAGILFGPFYCNDLFAESWQTLHWVLEGNRVLLECRVLEVIPASSEEDFTPQQSPGRVPEGFPLDVPERDPSRPFVDDRAFFNA